MYAKDDLSLGTRGLENLFGKQSTDPQCLLVFWRASCESLYRNALQSEFGGSPAQPGNSPVSNHHCVLNDNNE